MVAKTSPARRRAFFAALEATGNITIACARAKVSRSWVTLHKASDPAFRAACDAAVAASVARIEAAGGGAGLPAKLRYLAGEELVARAGYGRRIVIARARVKQWTPSAERLFLETLAATCNVQRGCAAVGLSAASAYAHRARCDSFARRWQLALEEGYLALECTMIAAAGGSLARDASRPGAHAGTDDWYEAKTLFALHRHAVTGAGKRPRHGPPRATPEETDRAILRALEIIDRQKAWQQALAEEAAEAAQGAGEGATEGCGGSR